MHGHRSYAPRAHQQQPLPALRFTTLFLSLCLYLVSLLSFPFLSSFGISFPYSNLFPPLSATGSLLALPSLCTNPVSILSSPLSSFVSLFSPLLPCLFLLLLLLLATLNQANPLRLHCHNKWRPQHLTKRLLALLPALLTLPPLFLLLSPLPYPLVPALAFPPLWFWPHNQIQQAVNAAKQAQCLTWHTP